MDNHTLRTSMQSPPSTIIKRTNPQRRLPNDNLMMPFTTRSTTPKPVTRRRPPPESRHRYKPPSRSESNAGAFARVTCCILVIGLVGRLFLSLWLRLMASTGQGQPYHFSLRPPPQQTTINSATGHRPRIVTIGSNEEPQSMFQRTTSVLSSKDEPTRIGTVEPMISAKMAELEQDSLEHDFRLADSLETTECQAQYAWQLSNSPICNVFHEMDTPSLVQSGNRRHNNNDATGLIYLNNGYWRDVWAMQDAWVEDDGAHNATLVLKTMRWMHNVTHRNFDRNMKDAVVMDHFKRSPWILDGYGFCGNTALTEYASGGDISNAIWDKVAVQTNHNDADGTQRFRVQIRNMTRREQFLVGAQAAIALAELHSFDNEKRASVAHTDISPAQFLKVGNRYKLSDFNRARFLTVQRQDSELVCPFYVEVNPGRNRSPEEYQAKTPLNEKIDLYSLANIFYMLLQKQWPFQEEEAKEAQRMVREGYRPSFYEDVWNSTDPYDMALKEAMIMCHEQDPNNRPTALELANWMKKRLNELEPGARDLGALSVY